MKRLISVLICAALLLCSVPGLSLGAVGAEEIDFTCGENMTWYLDTKTKTLTISGTGEMTHAPWLEYLSYIETVIIGEGVETICQEAFYNCSKLKSVTLPSTLTYMEPRAFTFCNELTSIALPVGMRELTYSITNCKNFSEVTFPDGCGLLSVSDSFASDCPFRTNQVGEVYVGTVLYGYNGEMPENYTLNIREGTTVVHTEAFKGQTNLTAINAPDSLFAVRSSAFKNTGWYNSLPDGDYYIGKVYGGYKGTMPLGNNVVSIPAGIKGIADGALSGCDLLTDISLPDSLVYIGSSAFQSTKRLSAFDFPPNVKYLMGHAFYGSGIKEIELPGSLEYLGDDVFLGCDFLEKVIFGKGYSLKTIPYETFRFCNVLREITIPDCVEKIEYGAFNCRYLEKAYIPSTVKVIGNNNFLKRPTFDAETVIYCAPGSAAHEYAIANNLSFVLLDMGDYTGLNEAVQTARGVDRSLYTEDSLAALDEVLDGINYYLGEDAQKEIDAYAEKIKAAVTALVYRPADYSALNAAVTAAKGIDRTKYSEASLLELFVLLSQVEYGMDIRYQTDVDGMTDKINTAVSALKKAPADYSAVDSAIRTAQGINRSLFTDEYLEKLDTLIASVDRSLSSDAQNEVDGYVSLINETLAKPEYRTADYSAVNAALGKAAGIERELYSNASLTVLDSAVEAVEMNLDIRFQAQVDSFAASVNSAVEALEFAAVTLREDTNGVIVSATAKEVHPRTRLAVDKVDPSEYEHANFGIGGTIKSISYFDINLILNAAKVQPKGRVTVKIRLPEGVNPSKCRVYHVTDDPVDPLVRFANTLDGNYIAFETDHFSEFAVIEVDTALTGLEIADGTKTVYAAGEQIKKDDIRLTANFSDGTSAVVSEFDISSVDMTAPGKRTVTLYYTFGGKIKSVSYVIDITPASGEAAVRIKTPEKYAGTFACGTGFVFYAEIDGADVPTIRWNVSGADYTVDGGVCRVKSAKGNFSVTCSVKGADGKVSDSDTLSVNVKSGFFDKIMAFFKGLFGLNKTIG